METSDIIRSVFNLLQLCRDNLDMLQEIFYTINRSSLRILIDRLDLQLRIYDQWRAIWMNNTGDADEGFAEHARSHPSTAEDILRQLCELTKMILDPRELANMFYIAQDLSPHKKLKVIAFSAETALTLERQREFLHICTSNLALLNKCHFKLADEVLCSTHVTDVRRHIALLSREGTDDLLRLTSRMEFDFLREMSADALRPSFAAAGFEYDSSSIGKSEKEKYYIVLATHFHLHLGQEYLGPPATLRKFSMRDIRLDLTCTASSHANSTMGLLLRWPMPDENRVVLIEWKYDNGTTISPYSGRTMNETAQILVHVQPAGMLLPKCYGIVEDPVQNRRGFIIAPPKHADLNAPISMLSDATFSRYMPISLRELILKGGDSFSEMLDLGIRFKVAKKLVASVHMMQKLTWMHENIRSSCILFFPKSSRNLSRNELGTWRAFDYDEPIFVGFTSPRVDRIDTRPPAIQRPRSPQRPFNTSSASSSSSEDISIAETLYRASFHLETLNLDEAKKELTRARRQARTERGSFPFYNDRPSGYDSYRRSDRDENSRSSNISWLIDYYQHPKKRADETVRHSRAHDIYSLGCVLLELGSWSMLDFHPDVGHTDFDRVRSAFVDGCRLLEGVMGSKYANVVRRCLTISTKAETEAEKRNMNSFMAEIGAELEDCCA